MQKPVLKIFTYLCLMGLLALTAVGCKKEKASSQENSSIEIEPATVRAQFVSPQMTLAGVFGALQQGYFDEQQLTVEMMFSNIVETAETLDVIDRVTSGEADFGLTSGDNLLQARQRGDDVVALMAIYQRDPTAVITLANKNITQPEDLVGKKLLVFSRSISLSLFLAAVGIDPSDVTIVDPPEGNINAGLGLFLTGQVDGMVATGTDASVQMTAIGIEHNLLFFNDYGVQMYPNVIFTTRTMIENQPDVVQRFVNALLDGLHYAISQPQAIATWFIENYADQLRPDQLESQDEVMLAIIPLLQSPDTKAGTMSAAVWEYVANGMADAGLIQDTVGYSQAFTTQFVDAYYAQQP